MKLTEELAALDLPKAEKGEVSFYPHHPSRVRYLITDCIPNELFLHQITVAGEDQFLGPPLDGYWLSRQLFEKLLAEWEVKVRVDPTTPSPSHMSLDLPTLQQGAPLKITYSATRDVRVVLYLVVAHPLKG